MKIIKEVCIDSYEEAVSALKKGADRLELCSELDLDGLTPDFNLAEKIISNLDIPVKIMLRNRADSFNYTKDDIQLILKQIKLFKKLKPAGFVFGALTSHNTLNLKQIEIVAKECFPFKLTIHKAIDCTENPINEISKLLKIENIKEILTSGKEKTAIQGFELLIKMIGKFGNRLTIIPAGKISKSNFQNVHNLINAKEYHGRKIVGDLTK